MKPTYRDLHHSDAELVAAHLAGKTAAWDALLERYERFIFRLILRTGLSGADAEDVFQNVCVKLYRHLEDLRQVQKLSGWLAVIIRREATQLLRQRMVGGAQAPPLDLAALPEISAPDILPEQTILAEERVRLVRQALGEMQEPCRQLLSLLYRPEPASYAQVSERLGVPPGSIGPRRGRCLERLKKILEQRGF